MSAGPTPTGPTPTDLLNVQERLGSWFGTHARDLPWRRSGTTPWGVLVSEVMSHQTPIARVLPVWEAWMARWPQASTLASSPPGEAVRAWGRLGYPRRALRLHQAATVIVVRHGGEVPSAESELQALPGIGRYTAAAVRAFAFGGRTAVLDTNVRRVLSRLFGGRAQPDPNLSVAEKHAAMALLPADDAESVTWNISLMELGALICTARAPACALCPVEPSCAWKALGSPVHEGAPRRSQAWHGTDRQVRGVLMATVREAPMPVTRGQLDIAWPGDPHRRERIIASLVGDGLLEHLPGDEYCLPGTSGR